MQGFNESIIFTVICLFLFKAVYGIGGESFVICEIDRFDDRSSPVGFVTQKPDELIYFAIAGKFDGDVFSFAVFAVNLICCMTDELILKTDCRLRYVITVRYDIVYFSHVVQVFD